MRAWNIAFTPENHRLGARIRFARMYMRMYVHMYIHMCLDPPREPRMLP